MAAVPEHAKRKPRLNYEIAPSFESFLHSPYTVVNTQVMYVDSNTDTMSDARDYQKEAVLQVHTEREAVLKFQNSIERFQDMCDEWSKKDFVVPTFCREYVPVKKSITVRPGITFQLQIGKQERSKVEFADDDDDFSEWYFRKSFYIMTREDKSTATFVVIEKLEK